MKHSLFFTLLLLSVLITQAAVAQRVTVERRTPVDSTTTIVESVSEDITPRRHAIMVNPLEFLLFYNFTYYHRIHEGLAIGAGFRVPTFEAIGGGGVHAEVRFYPSKRALKGFYLAPKASANRLSVDDDRARANSVGFRAGWQWFPSRHFSIGFGLGMDYYILTGEEDGDDFSVYEDTVPAIRFNIGYAW